MIKQSVFKTTIAKFTLLFLSTLLVNEGSRYLLDFDKLFYNSLAEKLSREQISEIFSIQEKWKFYGYIAVPFFILVKTFLIASILYIGVFFNHKLEATFQSLWEIVIKAEFIFLLVIVIKTLWFFFFVTNYTLIDVQNFYPLSGINIIGYQGLEPWFVYPFQALNLFELAYIIYLAYQIGAITKTSTDNGLKIMAFSYVPVLILWVVCVMFFILNYS